ncbi:MAG: 3-phosphoshikimate 1-carboxyvinyltransferase [Nanoarchaeota archaeon]
MIAIKTADSIDAVVKVPGSKSYTNRALPIAALADGKSVLRNVLFSDDTKYMVQALKEFGIKVSQEANNFIVSGKSGKLKKPNKDIFLGNAGTATRFLTTLSALVGDEVTITGDERMQERPIQDLLDALKKLGVNAISKNNNRCPPVLVKGPLIGGSTKLNGNISSQYLSSILMASPYAKKQVQVEIEGELTSKSYIDITLDIMHQFDVTVENDNYKKFSIQNQEYRPKNYNIEGDASNASYFFGAAAITKGKVRVENLNPDSAQGDINFPEVLKKMGCKVRRGEGWIEVEGTDLKGIDIDMNQMPDTVQTLAVVAAFAEGKTKITNVENLRVKETDRILALTTELRKIGAKVDELKDGLTITPNKLHGAEIDTYNDHRMAMAFAISGLNISGIKIKNPECVNKSFPGYFKEFDRLYKK